MAQWIKKLLSSTEASLALRTAHARALLDMLTAGLRHSLAAHAADLALQDMWWRRTTRRRPWDLSQP